MPLVAGAFLALGFSLPSCSSSDATASTGADAAPGADADTDAADAAVDAATGDAATEAGAMCDLGVLPVMPALTSEVVIEGADGGAAPTPTGGDVEGLWTYTKITLHLAAAAQGQVDPAASMITGRGFIELKAGAFRQLSDTTTVLSTSVVGKVTRVGLTKATGTYTVVAPAITFDATCREASADSGALGDVAFSRLDATSALMHVATQSQLGKATLVIALSRQP